MGAIAAKLAGFDEIKKDIDDLKTAVQLIKGISGQLEGKREMIEDGFSKLKQAKGFLDSQVGQTMEFVNRTSSQTEQIARKVTDVETQVNDIQKKVGMAKDAMNIGNKFKQGDVMGGLNDIKNKGFGGALGGFGF